MSSLQTPTALIVVDMQVSFVRGETASPLMPTVLPSVQVQLAAARAAGALVVFLQNDGLAGTVDEPETDGWQLALEREQGEVVIRKTHDNGFEGTDLDTVLQRYRTRVLSVCGVMSEMCVAATARDAMARGYEVVLAHDSHGTYDIPPFAEGETGVAAAEAARAAEWSLGDTIVIPPRATDVLFGGASDLPGLQRASGHPRRRG